MTISSMAAKGATEVLEDFQDRVVRMTVEQGFDKCESDTVFDELVAKYRAGKVAVSPQGQPSLSPRS